MKKEKISTAIMFFFIIIGMLSSIIIFHEIFHLIDFKTEPTGICFGRCYIGSELGEFAPAGIYWSKIPDKSSFDSKEKEIQAWAFGIVITGILGAVMIICQNQKFT